MYESFASIYDALMADAPYDNWAAYIDGLLGKWFNKKDLLVLDLACGTGSISLRLAKMGYEIIGVDSSEDMLSEAAQKVFGAGEEILFLRQDMRELDLFGTVDAVVCVCDGLNYILSDEDLLEVFKRVKLFLNDGGVFIFDMNTEYKFKEHFAGKILAGKGENGETYEWQNFYDPITKINEYNVTFLYDGEEFSELHKQRAYSVEDVCDLLATAGFASVEVRDDYSAAPPRADSLRVTYIVGS